MNVKKSTQDYYYERINNILHHISNHLDERFDLEGLAQLGNYSTFHFHRIMRAYLGEPLMAYIIRLRLETSVTLLRYSNDNIGVIALKVGYENPSSFNKAFKKRFGISPAEYRLNNELLRENKNSNLKFKKMKNLTSRQPKQVELESKNVIYAQVLGDYKTGAGKAWEKVCAFAEAKKLYGPKTEFIGISHDDPNITDAEKLRYDACIVVSDEVTAEGEIGVQKIAGGKFVVFTHKGPYERFMDSYDYIFGKWLPESGEELRNVPGFEKYLNDPGETEPEKLLTEIFIPIQ